MARQQYSEKLKHCSGCRDNYYNAKGKSGRADGLCWSIHDAELVSKREVGIHQRPPYKQRARMFLSCYHRQGYGYLAGKEY